MRWPSISPNDSSCIRIIRRARKLRCTQVFVYMSVSTVLVLVVVRASSWLTMGLMNARGLPSMRQGPRQQCCAALATLPCCVATAVAVPAALAIAVVITRPLHVMVPTDG